jgi:hypothetical protein
MSLILRSLPKAGVSKDESNKLNGLILRDASLRDAPQDEGPGKRDSDNGC